MQIIKLDVLDGLGSIEVAVTDPFVAARLELYFKQTKKMVLDDEARWPLPQLVDRFLRWPVPASVYPDGAPGKPGRTGTNLLTANEAAQMLTYVLSGETE